MPQARTNTGEPQCTIPGPIADQCQSIHGQDQCHVIGFVLTVGAENGEKLRKHAVQCINLDEDIIVAWVSMKTWIDSKNVGSGFTCIKGSVVADLEILMHCDLLSRLINSKLYGLLELAPHCWNQRQFDG